MSTAASVSVPGGVPLNQTQSNGAMSTAPSASVVGGVSLSYFDRFLANGFTYLSNRTFDEEFARLAKLMRWQPGSPAYRKQLKAAKAQPGAQMPHHSNLVANYACRFKDNPFQPNPELSFNEEFARLAEHMGWHPESKVYRKHRDRAMQHEVDGRKQDISSLHVFKQYADKNGYLPDPVLSFTKQFDSLAKHMRWHRNSEFYINTRRSALNEAVELETPLKQNTNTSRPISVVTSNELVRAPASIAPSSTYFSGFAAQGFTPNPMIAFEQEFTRLSIHMGWQPKSRERVEQWQAALESEMGDSFGGSDRLSGWQALCKELGVEDPPESITKCKKELQKIHVSIADLVNLRRAFWKDKKVADKGSEETMVPKKAVKIFKTVSALRKYCRNEHKFFPKIEAKQEGYIKVLLRQLVF